MANYLPGTETVFKLHRKGRKPLVLDLQKPPIKTGRREASLSIEFDKRSMKQYFRMQAIIIAHNNFAFQLSYNSLILTKHNHFCSNRLTR